jgi:hypothetical protein
VTAEDVPPRTAMPQARPPTPPANGSTPIPGAPPPPRRAVGVYDRPQRSFGGKALVLTGLIGIVVVLVVLWLAGIITL